MTTRPRRRRRRASRLLGQSVIDYVRGDVNRLHGRWRRSSSRSSTSTSTSLRELEKQFGRSVAGGAACMVPTRPDPRAFPRCKHVQRRRALLRRHHRRCTSSVLAQAMACDITRFGTLYMNDLSYAATRWACRRTTTASVAHTYDASADRSATARPAARATRRAGYRSRPSTRYSYGKVAKLMQKLDSLGALDSTLIYASSDMGNPALHSTRNVPTVLAGGANGKFRMGRRLKLKADCPTRQPVVRRERRDVRAATRTARSSSRSPKLSASRSTASAPAADAGPRPAR